MSVKQRLYPDKASSDLLVTHCEHARFVYNLGLEQRLMWRKDKKSPGYNEQAKQFTELRKELDWLRLGSSQIQQSALRDLDQAWKNYFQNSQHFKRPTWRKAVLNEGFVIQAPSVKRINRKWGSIFIPKHGYVKFRLTRPFNEIKEPKSARVSLKAGEWHVSFVALPKEFKREKTGAMTGIDRGVKNTLALSNGEFYHVPRLSVSEEKRLLLLQQKRSRTDKGSHRRKKLNTQIAKLKAKEARRKKDWVEKITTQLIMDYDLIGIEDLKVNNMTKAPAPKPDPDKDGAYLPNGSAAKAGLNKSILSGCWGLFRTRLEQKAKVSIADNQSMVVSVDPKNTSRECSKCHNVSAENRESQAVFKCKGCGFVAHADVNAALNVEYKALSVSSLKTDYAGGQSVNGQKENNGLSMLILGTTGETYEPVNHESPSFR